MSGKQSPYFILDAVHTDPARIKKEREKARELKKTPWWNQQLQKGICHYCEKKFKPAQLTMDHVVPLARGGTSTKGNIVAACHACNRDKKLETPVDQLLQKLSAERKTGSDESGEGEE